MCGLSSYRAMLPIALSAVILTASCSAQQAYGATLYYDPIHDASAVAMRDFDLRDTDRDRTLPIRVFAPTLQSAEGPLPTVVFSHGGGESREAFGYLGQAWARAGYLAVFLTHPGSDRAVVDALGMRALGASGGEDRPVDLSFVIDRLIAADTGEPLVDGRVDADSIAIAGQCAGTTTAFMLAGLTGRTRTSEVLAFPDPRPKCLMALGPQVLAPNPRAPITFTEEAWGAVEIPALVVVGTRDFQWVPAVRADPSLLRAPYDRMASETKYLVELQGAEHNAFTDSVPYYPARARDPRHHEWIVDATTAFLDAQLMGDDDARRWLGDEKLEETFGAECRQEHTASRHRDDAPNAAIASVDRVDLEGRQAGEALQVRVTYPTDGGPFPVILFSHAVGGSKDDHAALIESWARAGYVCIQPNHVDSSQMGGPGRSTLSAWPTRPADLSLIIDQLDAIEQADQALNGKLDHSRIGAAGHYIGSLAAGLLVGMRGFPAPGVDPVGFRDERVSAALMMSPVGRGQGLTESAWADMHGPVMVVTGEGDQSRRTGNPGDWRTEPFQFMPPGDKYLVWANELGEPSDGDWDQWAGPAAEPIEAATVAFWDAYLGRDGRARERLESGEIEADFAAAIEIRTKLLDRPAEEELVDFTEPGRYDIASIEELILHDRDRGKDLRIWVNYPIGDGPFPVVVFSHGAWASRGHYQPLTQFWASHGYVTIQPSHSDSRDLGGSPDRRAFRDWPSRPADVSFILDSLAALVELAPQLAGKLDPQHIGVAGHSFGANTAQIVGGAVPYVQGQPQPMADPRADAIVLLSPQGLGAQLTESSWDSMTSPTLHMTGSRDPGRNLQDPGWRLHPFEYSPPGHKYLVWVEGMDHGYGGMGGAGFEPATDGISYAPNPEHLEITRSVTTAFLDAYLKGSDAGRAFLEGPSPWTDVTITTK